MPNLASDVQAAVNQWWQERGSLSGFQSISVPIDALPHLKQLWADQSNDN